VTAQEILTLYAARWGVRTGLLLREDPVGRGGLSRAPGRGDRHVHAVVFLALLFVQVQRVHGQHRTLAEVLAAHRQGHLRQLLLAVAHHTLQHGAAEPVLKRFPREAA
jgi:hypothetical protein